jgi:hypothetical protein
VTAPNAAREASILHIACFLLASSRGLLEEPAGYGVYRCLEGARRCVKLARSAEGQDPALARIGKELDGLTFAPLQPEPDHLADELERLCTELALLLNAKVTRSGGERSSTDVGN